MLRVWVFGLLALAALPVFVAAGAGAARAQAGDIFTVRGVPVDETAGTAAEARQAALVVGQRRAFGRLIERLVPEDQQNRVPELDSNLLLYYVRDFSVDNERTSSVRYLADLTYRFNAEEVRALLRNHGVGFAETRSKPLVVLPVFEDPQAGTTLWVDPNPWREVWSRRPADEGLVPMVVPLGDLGDISAIDAEQALNGDAEALRRIAERNGAEAVLVTAASLSGDPETGSAVLEVVTRRYTDGARGASFRERVIQVDGEPYDGFLARAAERVDDAVQEAWKEQNVLQFGDQRSISVFVPLGGLDDWLKVRRSLEGVAAIQKAGLSRLSRDEAQVEITFVGDEERLTRALRQRDLFLSLRADSSWELSLTDGGPAALSLPSEGPAPGAAAEPSGQFPGTAPVPQ